MAHEGQHKQVRVLIVNDHVEEAEALCQQVEECGAQAAIAFGVVSAARTAVVYRPTLIMIANLRLGGDDGAAVVQWMRRDEHHLHRPMYVGVAHQANPLERQRYLFAGFDACIEMPITHATIDDLMRKALEGGFGMRHEKVPADAEQDAANDKEPVADWLARPHQRPSPKTPGGSGLVRR